MSISWPGLLFVLYEGLLVRRAWQVNRDRPEQSLFGALIQVNVIGFVLAPYLVCELLGLLLTRLGEKRVRALLDSQQSAAVSLYEVGAGRDHDRIESAARGLRLFAIGLADRLFGWIPRLVARGRAKWAGRSRFRRRVPSQGGESESE